LFENSSGENAQAIGNIFAVLIIVILCSCLAMTIGLSLYAIAFPGKRRIVLSRKSFRKLPRETMLEVQLVHAVSKIERDGQLEIKSTNWKHLLRKAVVDNLVDVLEGIDKHIDSSETETSFEENLLHKVLSTDQAESERSAAMRQMLKEFIQYNVFLEGEVQ
jgi:hypothetical protein